MSRTLFPKIMPYHDEFLSVGDNHHIYLEQSGNPEGIPVLYLHGGPGGGSSENNRRYFDPDKYRIILFDQRGCGRSQPSPSLENNTTWHLINDIELIRQHLMIDQWLIAGGSWGTTLAIAYGIEHADRVLGFILRGVFLGTQAEYDWLYQAQGAAKFYPEYYQDFIEQLSDNKRSDNKKSAIENPENKKSDNENPLECYYKQLTSDNEVAAIAASKAWCLWELRLSTLEHHNIGLAQVDDTHQALCMAKISSYYFKHHCFFSENYLLDNITKIAHLPAIVLHGRFDMVCQLYIADLLVKHWENARLQILPCAGHSGFESQTIDAFCKAADVMANFIDVKENE